MSRKRRIGIEITNIKIINYLEKKQETKTNEINVGRFPSQRIEKYSMSKILEETLQEHIDSEEVKNGNK